MAGYIRGEVTVIQEAGGIPGPLFPVTNRPVRLLTLPDLFLNQKIGQHRCFFRKPGSFSAHQIGAETAHPGIQTFFFPVTPLNFSAVQRYTHPMNVRPDTRYPRIVTFPLFSVTE
jgi:hypothetical protein